MIITDATSAYLFAVGVWNKIAELTGSLVDTYGPKLSAVLERFGSPPATAYFWTPSLIRWIREQANAVSEASRVLSEALEEWRKGVRKIVSNAVHGELPLPKKLHQRVMPIDDAWRMAIRLLFDTADTISESDREENTKIILEVAQPSRLDDPPVDTNPDATTLQRVWRGVVRAAVAFASATLPFALAWVAAVAYLRLWQDDPAALSEALPQDSQRFSGVSTKRRRRNKQKGPDK